jgi:hypothetical protein
MVMMWGLFRALHQELPAPQPETVKAPPLG